MAVLNKNSALEISAWGIYKTLGQFKSVAVMNRDTYVIVSRESGTFMEKFDDDATLDSGEFGFSHTASAMPFFAGGRIPKKVRIYKISARVSNTKSLFINSRRIVLPNKIYADNAQGFSGDVSVGMLGTSDDTTLPIWTITGSDPLPATILSVTTEGWYLI